VACATVYLGLEARLSRREARRDAVVRPIRAAVREQLDNLGAWLEVASVGYLLGRL
jgi:hypothetical protein